MTKKYDKFKLQSVRLIQEEGKSVAQVARKWALHENTLTTGSRNLRTLATEHSLAWWTTSAGGQLYRDLQKRIRNLEEENDIKKACTTSQKTGLEFIRSSMITASQFVSRRC
ncbi:transposase [Paenibacillus larvae]|nr:transposase [Paenibacillus larvae]MDT2293271.1 transposase [Paenibacillus larvae]